MNVGIDKIGFATTQYLLNMDDLAKERGVDPDKIQQRFAFGKPQYRTHY